MSLTVTTNDEAVISVMQDSIYPGAKAESVRMVLAYCRAKGYDPMRKPVHIVPVYVKEEGRTRDVVMPGIIQYRIDAARTGAYAGKSEPEFGPMVTLTLGGKPHTVPEWCRVTVKRIVAGEAREFTAVEYWIENYATAKRDTDAPNAMWAKRARGQLAKCAEAQALRMAFPEEIGGEYTAEEMEGKALPPARGPVMDAEPEAPRPAMASGPKITEGWSLLTPVDAKGVPAGTVVTIKPSKWGEAVQKALGMLESAEAVRVWRDEMAPHFAVVAASGGSDDVDAAREHVARRLDEFALAEEA